MGTNRGGMNFWRAKNEKLFGLKGENVLSPPFSPDRLFLRYLLTSSALLLTVK